jgi:hypothetical protein
MRKKDFRVSTRLDRRHRWRILGKRQRKYSTETFYQCRVCSKKVRVARTDLSQLNRLTRDRFIPVLKHHVYGRVPLFSYMINQTNRGGS